MSATLDTAVVYPNGEIGGESGNTLVAVTADNAIISVSEKSDVPNLFVVTRTNADGTPDATFGVNGAAEVFIGTGESSVTLTDVAVGENGSVYFTGVFDSLTQNRLLGFVGKVDAEGQLVTGFGGSGQDIADLHIIDPQAGNVAAPHLLAQGNSLFVGYTVKNLDFSGTNVAGVSKLNADGTLDGGFTQPLESEPESGAAHHQSTTGTVYDTVPGVGSELIDLFINAADGSLTVVGQAAVQTDPEAFVIPMSAFAYQLESTGAFDTDFEVGGDGFLLAEVNADGGNIEGIARTADADQYVVATNVFGATVGGYTAQVVLLSGSFGVTSTVLIDASENAMVGVDSNGARASVAIDDNGFIYVAAIQPYAIETGDPESPYIFNSKAGVIRLDDGVYDGFAVYAGAYADEPGNAGSVVVDGLNRAVVGGLTGGATTILRYASTNTTPTNLPPTVVGLTDPDEVLVGSSVHFEAIVGDPNSDTLSIAWQIGNPDQIPETFQSADAGLVAKDLTFNTLGQTTVTLFVKDAAGAVTSQTVTVNVVAPPPVLPYVLAGGKLSVTGTSGADTVTLTLNAGQVVLGFNGSSYSFASTAITSLVIEGGAGSDFIKVSTAFTIPTTLLGGVGDDTLRGGSGIDVMLGDLGNDVLVGRDGQDLMIGDDGADVLIGREEADILISGTTTLSRTALDAVMAEWTSDHTYGAKLNNITNRSPRSDRLNGANFLTPDGTVFNDSAIDTLSGGEGTDLYYIAQFGPSADEVKDNMTRFSTSVAALVFND